MKVAAWGVLSITLTFAVSASLGCNALIGLKDVPAPEDASATGDDADASVDTSVDAPVDAPVDTSIDTGADGADRDASADTGKDDGGARPCSGSATQACGNCGTQTRTCDGTSGTWSGWSPCDGEGDCAPNTSQSCGTGGTQSCGSDCKWSACGNQSCVGAATQPCGNCGTQARTCDASTGMWSAWSACSGEGQCAPNSTQSCGAGGMQSCGGDCTWGSCGNQTCSGPTTQPCGNCGTQARTCDASTGMWSAWSACKNEGVCAPSSTTPCGSGGTATCDSATCQWGQCMGQNCGAAPLTQSCSCNGTQSRTCNNGVLSAWSTCSPTTDTTSDTANCGSCNHNCLNLANVKSAHCANSVCVIDACATKTTPNNAQVYTAWADCDSNVNTGCETSLTSSTNCGACGQDCALCPSASIFWCTTNCNSSNTTGPCLNCLAVGTSHGPHIDCNP